MKLDKVKFYEKYNKKFNIIMYYILNIENYKYKKFLFQLRYLNQIKGMEELKNAKIEFLKNFNSVIISIINIMFESLNTLIYLKACFNELKIYKYIIPTVAPYCHLPSSSWMAVMSSNFFLAMHEFKITAIRGVLSLVRVLSLLLLVLLVWWI